MALQLADLTILAAVTAFIVCCFVLFLLVRDCSQRRNRSSKTYCALCLHDSDSSDHQTISSPISLCMSSPRSPPYPDYSSSILQSPPSTPQSPSYSPLLDLRQQSQSTPFTMNLHKLRGVSTDSGVQSCSPMLVPCLSPVISSTIPGETSSRVNEDSILGLLTHMTDFVPLSSSVSPHMETKETCLESEIEEDYLVLVEAGRQMEHIQDPSSERKHYFTEKLASEDCKVLPSSSPYRPGYSVSTCEDVLSPNRCISPPEPVSPPIETLFQTRVDSEICSQPESLDWDNYMIGPWS